MVDHTVAPPLAVDVALAAPGQTIEALLRPTLPKDGCNHGAPLAIHLPGCWRGDLRDHLV